MRDARLTPVLLLEAATALGGIGNAVVMVVIPWLVLERTDSPAATGIVAAVMSLPGIASAPLVGVLADRFGRRIVSVASDACSALSVLLFPLVDGAAGLTYGWIVALAVLGAVFDPAGYTARKSLLPDAAAASGIDRDKLNGVHEGIFAAGWVLGPAVAALLIRAVGAVDAMWAAFGLFALAALAAAMIRVHDAGSREATEPAEPFWASTRRGASILWRDRPLRALTLSVMVLAVVYLPTESVLLPTYFERAGQPEGLGLTLALLAAGSMVGAFAYGWMARRLSRYAIVRVALLLTAAAMFPMALLPPMPVFLCAGFLLGLGWGPMSPLLNTLVQVRVPPEAQARVYGVQLSLFYAVPPVGQLIAGAATERLGVQVTYLAVAVLLAATAVAVLFVPSLRRLDEGAAEAQGPL